MRNLSLISVKTQVNDLTFVSDRSGYEAAAKHFTPGDLEVNLSGRSFMITGANSGIGKATAQEIANRGQC